MTIGKKSRRQVGAIRQTIFDRDEHCVVQGSLWAMLIPCAGGLTVQHRVGRGMGSSAKSDTASHLVAMCAIHNGLETANAPFSDACERMGWSVPRWVQDRGHSIAQVPVWADHAWWLLPSNGGRVSVAESTAIAMMVELYGENENDD